MDVPDKLACIVVPPEVYRFCQARKVDLKGYVWADLDTALYLRRSVGQSFYFPGAGWLVPRGSLWFTSDGLKPVV